MKRSVFVSIIIFVVAAAVCSALYFRIPTLRDYDSYYHTKMGEIIMEKGLIKEFPWAQFTFLRDHFVNPYFLFHAYLGLWIKALPVDPLIAVKLAMIVLLGFVALAYAKVVKTFHTRWAWLGLALLPAMCSYLTYQRLTQVRPQVVSILILLLGTGAILERKWRFLALLSFIYVYSYSAPHLLPVVAVLAVAVFSLKEKRLIWQPAAYSLGGMVAGLVANPYFPRNIHYLYVVTFKLASRPITFTSVTPSELLSINSWLLLSVNALSLAVLFLSVLAAFVAGKKLSTRSLFLFVTAAFFFLLVARSLRFIEYWPFFASLAACSILAETAVEGPWFRRLMKKPVEVLCGAALLTIGAFQIRAAFAHAVTFVPFAPLKEVVDVLDREAAPGEIVYTKDWDQTQPMFFLSDKVRYLMMFDPELMRMTHPGLYDLWYFINNGRVGSGALSLVRSIEGETRDPEIHRLRTALETGEVLDRLPDIIKSAYGAKWIIWSHKNARELYELRSILSSFPVDIVLVKENEAFSLYRLR